MEEKKEILMDDDDVILPGFRFHPTDEELVDFYLRRKIQHKCLPTEIIKQVEIYQYDPWDLPKVGSSGEKEWYFFCKRDRKYRNSTRPNRVTKSGFWKATGTDRAIYDSSQGKCIGLKKSLVFYRGRAAKGFKTEWMMHEFRLPPSSPSNLSHSQKLKPLPLPPTESWAICRIFKKANSMCMAHKALSHPWITQLPESMVADILNQFSPENLSSTTETTTNNAINDLRASDIPMNNAVSKSNGDIGESFIFSTMEGSSSMLLNPDCGGLELGPNQQYFSGFSESVAQDVEGNMNRGIGFPFSLPWDSPFSYS